jgi:preprotein translocase subunit SecD
VSTAARLRQIFLCCPLAAVLILPIAVVAGEVVVLEVASASADIDPRVHLPIISIKLSETSKTKMGEITTKNVGRVMALRVDGRELLKPVIREPIVGGALQISGSFTTQETKDLVKRLTSGGKIEVEVIE